MVTTVGTETHIVDLLSDLIQLDYDAADAYQAAIDRSGNPQFAATVSAFREDHLRHVAELSTILTAMGQMPSEQGDMKSLLGTGQRGRAPHAPPLSTSPGTASPPPPCHAAEDRP